MGQVMAFIEIDGKKIAVRPGQMIIEAADEVGINIPRFCYHKKLSIAANCRMCLVDVANAPKPLPACATAVFDGMKISTLSARAQDAQKAVMEFLLINHPLDCPICDQGGQCELQDVALMYGKDSARFSERKRVVKDKNIGPLISTDMTRCIHCTRCVRFGEEIAGLRELGATGRGEFMQIGTYIENSVTSELSGNVIDLCPVGALTSKPFRFVARAWELQAHPSISPHDCLGSHLFFHTLRNQVKRTLPSENEAINEVWLSDRDRFSYQGFNHPQRLTQPLIKREGKWQAVDWETALHFTHDKLNAILEQGPEQLGILASPSSTLEEFYLLQKLFRAKKCMHFDHRLRMLDYHHQDFLGTFPTLGLNLAELEAQQAIIVIGSDLSKEQPLISYRLRKAAQRGAQIYAIHCWQPQVNFHLTQWVGEKGDFITPLQGLLKALLPWIDQALIPDQIKATLASITPSESMQQAAQTLCTQKVSILLGAYAWSHPQASHIYQLSRLLAHLLRGSWGEMSQGANSAGAWLAGMLPHRLPFGQATQPGLNAQQMWQQPRRGYFLFNCEPEYDCATPYAAHQALVQAQTVVALSAYENSYFREYAEVLLPIALSCEMSGTYINALGQWQSFQAALTPLGESRPAWKILRVLANLWQIPQFSYETIEAVRQEITTLQSTHLQVSDRLMEMPASVQTTAFPSLVRLAPTPLYRVDGIVRRAPALQQTADAKVTVKINARQAQQMGLQAEQLVWVEQQGNRSAPMPICIDEHLPDNVVMVAAGLDQTWNLDAPFGAVQLIPYEE